MERPDYFDAKAAVKRLEEALNKHVITPPEERTFEHIVDLGGQKGVTVPLVPKESLVDFVVRRRSELDKQMEELSFLQDVAELMRKHPRFFGENK